MHGSGYWLGERIGGSRASVWLAAVKGAEGFRLPVVLKRAASDDPQARAELRREALISALLRHPHVVRVHDLFEDDGELVLAMEYVSGVSVRELPQPVPWHVAARIVADVARGLGHAHELKDPGGRSLAIVHRDVSPDNLLVSELGHTLIADFGIARSRFTEVTHHAVVKGTRGYLSPEQARGDLLDARSDVFSLGLVALELVGGELPARGPDGYAVAAAGADRVEAPAAVRDLLKRMLSLDRSRRPTMLSVAQLLCAVASEQGADHAAVAAFLRTGAPERLEAVRARVARLLGAGGGAEPSELVALSDASTGRFTLTRLDEEGEPTDLDPLSRDRG